MDIDALRSEPDDETPQDDADTILDALIGEEMGEQIADAMRTTRRRQEGHYRRLHPEEGLRERKRRQTRQVISDAATVLFATRGFDKVKVSEVAERVGVSEKTIYNYFPTKESMVLDQADEMVERVAGALRERQADETLTAAIVRALKVDMEQFDAAPEVLAQFLPRFVQMFEQTPSLRAATLELQDRIARVATEELALAADVDPRDPEPIAAGRALIGLMDVGMASRVRHTEDGLRGQALHDAVVADVERAARLLETGLWSFNLPRSERARNQVRDATRAAEEARLQVITALREARVAWDELRATHHESAQQVRQAQRDAREQGRRAGREAREEARRAVEAARRAHRDEMQETLRAIRAQVGNVDWRQWSDPEQP
jgi:AcrR family transcriptional regulator